MALLFDSDTEYVNCGSDASLDNLSQATILAWVYPTLCDTKYRRIYSKKDADELCLQITDSWNSSTPQALGFSVDHLGDSDEAYKSNVIVNNAWNFVGGSWAGIGNVPKLYYGDLTTLVSEVAPDVSNSNLTDHDDSSGDARLGHRIDGGGSNSYNFQGIIAVVAVFEEVLNLTEIRAFQYRPYLANGIGDCKLLVFPGLHGGSSVPDFSGNSNTGTITNATLTDGPPLGPIFGWDIGASEIVSAGANYVAGAINTVHAMIAGFPSIHGNRCTYVMDTEHAMATGMPGIHGNRLTSAINTIHSMVSGNSSIVVKFLVSVMNATQAVISNTVTSLVVFLVSAMDGVLKQVSGFTSIICKFATSAMNSIMGIVSGFPRVPGRVKVIIVNTVHAIVSRKPSISATFLSSIRNVAHSMVSGMPGAFATFLVSARNVAHKQVSDIINTISLKYVSVRNTVHRHVSSISNVFVSFKVLAVNTVHAIPTRIVSVVTSIPAMVVGVLRFASKNATYFYRAIKTGTFFQPKDQDR